MPRRRAPVCRSRGAIMACDPAMCAALAQHGVPPANLLVLGPGAGDPLGSDLVVGTAAVRGLFGSRLAGVYAPEVLASFGTGAARVDVRAVAPDGSARYRQALAAGPGLPVRTARLAASGGTARRMLAFLRAQRSPYQPGYAGTAGSVVTVEFAAPAPLGLLGNH